MKVLGGENGIAHQTERNGRLGGVAAQCACDDNLAHRGEPHTSHSPNDANGQATSRASPFCGLPQIPWDENLGTAASEVAHRVGTTPHTCKPCVRFCFAALPTYHVLNMSRNKDSMSPGDVTLVYTWDDPASRQVAETLCLRPRFGVTMESVARMPPDSLDLGTKRVVACVLFVSPKALSDESFSTVVSQSTGSRLLRPDFRLFVWLMGGLTPDALRELAKTNEACSLLLESVHLPRRQTEVTAATAGDLLDQYLSELGEYRDEVAARSLENRMAVTILWCTGLLMLNGLLGTLAASLWGPGIVEDPVSEWALFGSGQFAFYVILSLTSLRSPSMMGWAGTAIRVGFTAIAVWLLRTIPAEPILAHWHWVAGGIAAAAIGDAAIRTLVGAPDQALFQRSQEAGAYESVPPPGLPNWRFFFCEPMIPKPPRVFISYTESTEWSSRTAGELWHELRNDQVPSFYAPKCISPGSSWQHRLQEELRRCSLFVMVQDEKLMSQRWPQTELHAACARQARYAEPSVVVLRRPGAQVSAGLINSDSRCTPAVLSPAPVVRPGLAVAEYTPSVERRIVASLANRWKGFGLALLPGFRGRILESLFAVPCRILVGLGRHSGVATTALLLLAAGALAAQRQHRFEVAPTATVLFVIVAAYLCGWQLSSTANLRLRYRMKVVARAFRFRRSPLLQQLYLFFQAANPKAAVRRLQLRVLILVLFGIPMLLLISSFGRVCSALALALGCISAITDDETTNWRSAVSDE